MRRHLFLLTLSVIALAGKSAPAADDNQLAQKAFGTFQRYCFECHGKAGSLDGGMGYVNDLAQLVQRGKVVPKQPDKSRVIIRLRSKDDPMPPSEKTGADRPDATAIAAIESWIAAGAPPLADVAADKEPPRSFVSNSAVIAAIFAHLNRIDEEDRPYQRYFTLNHLHNMPAKAVSSSRLRIVRAAVTKALNSLSWKSDAIIPQPIDADGTVLAFDVRDVDWDASATRHRADLWLQMLGRYPYGLKNDLYPDERRTRDMAKQIYAWTGVEIPAVRADWFVATALQPPLYHTLLYDKVFPDLAKREKVKVKLADGADSIEPAMTAGDLEKWLQVDAKANIRRDRAVRAGFTRSGVSAQPRVIERHPAIYGGYWKSYDFKPNNSTSDPTTFPLGPPGTAQGRIAPRFEFKQDGGEIVFHLPNGLQGYLLVDANDHRINVGPSDVVEDSSKLLGNSLIANGLSCVACHKLGMKREFNVDQVRFGVAGLSADARDKTRKLYVDPVEMNRLIDKDEVRFLRGVEESVGGILRNGADKRETSALDEPVGPIAKTYLGEELDLAIIATELGIAKPDELKIRIESNPELQRIGLAGVAGGGKIKRYTWESGAGLTLFQQAARILRLGTPTSVEVGN